jgi:hypothetical protein
MWASRQAEEAAELAAVRAWTRWLGRWLEGHDAATPRLPLPVASLERAGLLGWLHAAGAEVPGGAERRMLTMSENVAHLSNVRRLGGCLDAEAVGWCAIKGCAAIGDDRVAVGARRMSDADVLVEAASWDAALGALQRVGWDVRRGRAAGGDHTAMARWRGGPPVDLHRSLGIEPLFVAADRLVLGSVEASGGLRLARGAGALAAVVVHRARGSWSSDLREVVDVRRFVRTTHDDGAMNIVVNGLADAGLAGLTLLALREGRTWLGESPASSAMEAGLTRRLDPRRRRAIDALAARIEARGALVLARLPVVGRYIGLALLADRPGDVLTVGARHTAGRLRDALRLGPRAGGRAGAWLSRLRRG